MLSISSVQEYETFIYSIPDQYSSVQVSTLVYISLDAQAGEVEGSLFFQDDIELRVYQLLNFEANRIVKYSYEVYQANEKLHWYDSFPHPHIPELAKTDPHHKHVLPDIKHHRVPAPDPSFERATRSVPFLIREIEAMLLK
ncbi:MAG: hypothetical protein KGJ80_13175 [Chloroflexota bacterium]|nr:hypothetical protein [Chloroflexota bacterium]